MIYTNTSSQLLSFNPSESKLPLANISVPKFTSASVKVNKPDDDDLSSKYQVFSMFQSAFDKRKIVALAVMVSR